MIEQKGLSAAERAIQASIAIAPAALLAGAEITEFYLESTEAAEVIVDLPDAVLIDRNGNKHTFDGFYLKIIFGDTWQHPRILCRETGHPHVGNNHIVCTGGYSDDMYDAAARGDWQSLLALSIACINTYSPGDAYHRIDVIYVRCSSCGEDISKDDAYFCNNCGDTLCEECQYHCDNCFSVFCEEHIIYRTSFWSGLAWLDGREICQECRKEEAKKISELRRELIKLANTTERRMKLWALLQHVKRNRKNLRDLEYQMYYCSRDWVPFWVSWSPAGRKMSRPFNSYL